MCGSRTADVTIRPVNTSHILLRSRRVSRYVRLGYRRKCDHDARGRASRARSTTTGSLRSTARPHRTWHPKTLCSAPSKVRTRLPVHSKNETGGRRSLHMLACYGQNKPVVSDVGIGDGCTGCMQHLLICMYPPPTHLPPQCAS